MGKGKNKIAPKTADEIFQACDRNADGRVSKRELKSTLKANEALLKKLNLKRLKDVHEFIDRFDDDGDQGIDIDEFHRALGINEPPEEPVTVGGGGGGGGQTFVAAAKKPLIEEKSADKHEGRHCAACEFSGFQDLLPEMPEKIDMKNCQIM